MHLALIFVAGYASVFLLGFQSRNVNHGNYRWAAGTSFAIAIMQTSLWGALFRDLTWASALVYGLSGATGITTSMFVHQRWIRPKPKEPTTEELMLAAAKLLRAAGRSTKA